MPIYILFKINYNTVPNIALRLIFSLFFNILITLNLVQNTLTLCFIIFTSLLFCSFFSLYYCIA